MIWGYNLSRKFQKEWTIIFNKAIIEYVCGIHAKERVVERFDVSLENAEYFIREKIIKGRVLLDIGNHRYIQSEDLFLPCVKLKENLYKVKSVLTWDMVCDRFQSILDNIDKYEPTF